MSSWVQLLLVVLAACPRFAVAEGDPLPAALVELVRNSPISSAEDLQLLLLSDSVDGEDGNSAASGGHRLPRSLSAQPALLALCKVRTEVVEVTRAMLDRSNGNFMLWPPCVEVQRCSGCCNAKTLQCVPVVTHTRYLQVTKIEFINMRPAYAKAVVSVVDHVECRCQLAPAPKKKSFHRQLSSNQRQNQTLSQGHGQGQGKVHSKEELHQWDELKQNQRTHLEDLLDEQWSSRGDTFPPVEGYSLPGEDPAQLEEAALFAPHWTHNSTRLQAESPEEVEGKDDRIADGNKTVSSEKDSLDGGHGFLLNSSEGRIDEESFGGDAGTQTHSPLRPEDKSEPVTGSRLRPTKEPNPDPRGQERRRNNETPDEERILKMEEMKLEEERKELLLLHKRLDEEKEILRQQQTKREDEERQKGKELAIRHGKHHHQQLTPTHTPESTTSMTTTRKPPAPSGPRPPARPSQTRRRIRKNRKRISKAAMRAMLM